MPGKKKSKGAKRARAMAAEFSGAAREQAEAAFETVVDVAEDGIDEAYDFFKRQVRERPLAVTGAAIGIGLLIGLMLSSGRR